MHTVSLLHGSGLEHGVATWTGLQAAELERVARNQEREAAADAERVARIQQKEAAAEARSSQRLAAAQALLAEKEAARHEAEMHRQAVVRPVTAETQIQQNLRVCFCPFRGLRSVFMIFDSNQTAISDQHCYSAADRSDSIVAKRSCRKPLVGDATSRGKPQHGRRRIAALCGSVPHRYLVSF